MCLYVYVLNHDPLFDSFERRIVSEIETITDTQNAASSLSAAMRSLSDRQRPLNPLARVKLHARRRFSSGMETGRYYPSPQTRIFFIPLKVSLIAAGICL